MKSDPLRLASLFFETGMIDSATFSKCTAEYGSGSKSLFEVLKQDVSLSSIRELQDVSLGGLRSLLTMEIDLPFTSKNDRKAADPIHDALSQPFYLTSDDMKAILNHWKPPVEPVVRALESGKALDKPASEVLAEVGEGEGVYNRLVDGAYLQTRTVNRAVTATASWGRKSNRLLLAVHLLRHNDILSQEDSDLLLERYSREGDSAIPLLNEEIQAFIKSEPHMPEVDLRSVRPPEALRDSLPVSFIRQNLFLPFRRVPGRFEHLEILVSDPFYVDLTDTLAFLTGIPVVGYYATGADIIRRINEVFDPLQGALEPDAEPSVPLPSVPPPRSRAETRASAEPAPERMADSYSAVELVSRIIEGGVQSRATDIHLEPTNKHLRVRYRIDGRLRAIMQIPAPQVLSVISRIKVLSNLDVTERRRPQDGHFSLKIGAGAFDFRVSTLPTHLGEKTVIRILDASRVLLSLQDLGMPVRQVDLVRKWISRPHGLLLVSGPTGSGKTSTLYAALNTVNSEEKNIVTIEDPVEYRLEGINQVQVDSTFDLSFAQGLRSILRQDPDTIMVGEIRDPETARIALRAALTGHLVFSTLHTNTAAGAIATLCNMGIEPYMLASALTGVINQRLVRMLCPSCKQGYVAKKAVLESLHLPERPRPRMWRAVGCPACLMTGYLGRIGIFEIMPMTPVVSEAILSGRGENELVALLRTNGYGTLLDGAIEKLRAGLTSAEEILETLVSEP